MSFGLAIVMTFSFLSNVFQKHKPFLNMVQVSVKFNAKVIIYHYSTGILTPNCMFFRTAMTHILLKCCLYSNTGQFSYAASPSEHKVAHSVDKR